MEELEIEDSTYNLQNANLNRSHPCETICKLDQEHGITDGEHMGDGNLVSDMTNKDQQKAKVPLNERGLQGNGQDDDAGVTTEAKLPGDRMLNEHLTKKSSDHLDKQAPQEVRTVSDGYLIPIPQQLIPRCTPEAARHVPHLENITDVPTTEKPPDPLKNHDYLEMDLHDAIYVSQNENANVNPTDYHDYLEMDIYDEIYVSPIEYENVNPTDGQNQRRLSEPKETLPVPVGSPRGPPWERKALMVVLIMLIIGASLVVYFSIEIQMESPTVTFCGMNETAEAEVETVNVSGETFDVPVTVDPNGDRWMMLMKRIDGSVPFEDYNWVSHVNGFGDLTGEFWLGLEKMHLLTTNGSIYTLKVDLASNTHCHYATFRPFSVDDVTTDYTVHWGPVTPEQDLNDPLYAGDGSYTSNDNQRFTTYDNDNDNWSGGNLASFNGGWWYGIAVASKLTGIYDHLPSYYSIRWTTLPNDMTNIMLYADMKIKIHP